MADIDSCLAQSLHIAEQKEKRVFAKTLKCLSGYDSDNSGSFKGVPKLKAAERYWVQYRDAQCFAEGAIYTNGSGRPNAVLYCKEKLTEFRIKELEQLLMSSGCPEHSLSGGSKN